MFSKEIIDSIQPTPHQMKHIKRMYVRNAAIKAAIGSATITATLVGTGLILQRIQNNNNRS